MPHIQFTEAYRHRTKIIIARPGAKSNTRAAKSNVNSEKRTVYARKGPIFPQISGRLRAGSNGSAPPARRVLRIVRGIGAETAGFFRSAERKMRKKRPPCLTKQRRCAMILDVVRTTSIWCFGSVGRAHRSHRWGHWFESSKHHQILNLRIEDFFFCIGEGETPGACAEWQIFPGPHQNLT